MARLSFGRFKAASADAPAIRIDLVGPPDDGSLLPMGAPTASSVAPNYHRAMHRAMHRERGKVYVATDGLDSVATADLAAGEVVVFVAAGTDPRVLRSVLIESPVWRFAAYHGLTALHAASIVIDGRSLVLRGVSGAGKSTLALAAALAGHTVLAEEVTWVDLAHDCLRGMPWTVRVDEDAVGFFRLPPALQASVDGPAVKSAAPDASLTIDLASNGARTTEIAPLGPLVILERRREGEAGLSALSPHAARVAFKRTLLAGESTQRPAQLGSARDALLQRGAWLLSFSEPHGALRQLELLAAGTP